MSQGIETASHAKKMVTVVMVKGSPQTPNTNTLAMAIFSNFLFLRERCSSEFVECSPGWRCILRLMRMME